ncbi:MAG: pentapeptide repeat-containing protein [Cyanobacteria bacterium J06554_11]
MQTKMLLQRYELGKRDFSWVDLQGADLSFSDLPEINLYRANLTDANLQGSNLIGANLFKATLTQANLKSANLTAANLSKADLTDALVEDACMDGAKLRGATLPDGTCFEPPEPDPEPDSAPKTQDTDGLAIEDTALNLTDAPLNDLGPSSDEPINEEPSPFVDKPINTKVFDTNDPLWCLGMVGVICGFLCYGLLLHDYQLPLLVWPLVWSSIFMAQAKPESVWVVPVTAAALTLVCIGIGLLSLILTCMLVLLNIGGILSYGSILGQKFKKTVQDGLFLCAFSFVALNMNFYIFLGTAIAGFGFLFLLRDSHEVQSFIERGDKRETPRMAKRRQAERSRLYKQFAIAAFIGLALSGMFSLP